MYEIHINSRKLVNYLLQGYLGMDEVQAPTVIRLVDRLHKMPRSEFSAEDRRIVNNATRG